MSYRIITASDSYPKSAIFERRWQRHDPSANIALHQMHQSLRVSAYKQTDKHIDKPVSEWFMTDCYMTAKLQTDRQTHKKNQIQTSW